MLFEECENKANEGQFKLRYMLAVPMQRILKYHLLLQVCLEPLSTCMFTMTVHSLLF